MNHRTAPIEVRERLAIPLRDLTGALRALRLLPGVEEIVILSTCNRTECYAASAGGEGGAAILRGFLLERAGEAELAAGHLYGLRGGEAITHLYHVSASLDSLVVGEPQVLSQVKAAYETARSEGVTGVLLNRAFQGALEARRRVRAETAIGTGLVSVSSVAVDLARKIFGDLASRKAIILGTGEMGELTLTHLVSQGVRVILVASRTYERAVALARLYEGTAIRYEALPTTS